MSAAEISTLIAACSAAILAIIGALTTFFVTIRTKAAVAETKAAIADVHTIVNSKSDVQLATVTRLENRIETLQADALATAAVRVAAAEGAAAGTARPKQDV